MSEVAEKQLFAEAPSRSREFRKLLVLLLVLVVVMAAASLIVRLSFGWQAYGDGFSRDEDITRVDGKPLGGTFEMISFSIWPSREAVRIRWRPEDGEAPGVVAEVFASGEVFPHQMMLMPREDGLWLRIEIRGKVQEVLLPRARLLEAVRGKHAIVYEGKVLE